MTTDIPNVSVVIPFYKGELFVAQAIEYALGQDHPRIEVIVVDDGSPSGSGQVLRQFEDRVTIVRQTNQGVASARNRGIEQASGEFIAFLDQDDWWLPEKISRQLELFQANPQLGLVHTAVAHFEAATGRPVGPLNPAARPEQMVGDCSQKLRLGNPIYNSSVMVRRKVLERVGTCDSELAGNTVADYDLWLRIAEHFEFGYVDQPLTCYRMHDQQGMLDRRAMLTAELRVLMRIQDEQSWIADPAGQVRIANLYDDLAVAWYDAGNPGTARRYFAKAWGVSRSRRALKRWIASQLPRFIIDRLRSST